MAMRKMSGKSELVFMILLAVIFIAALVWMFSTILDAIAYAIVLAYVSRPITNRLRKYMGLPLASFLTLLVLVLVMSAVLFYTGIRMFSEINEISSEDVVQSLLYTSKLVTRYLNSHPELQPIVTAFSNQVNNYMSWLADQVITTAIQFVSLLVTLVLSFVISFFLIADGPRIKKFVLKVVPSRIAREINWMDKNLYGIFVGSVFSAFVVGLITVLVFLITGIPYAFLSGFFAGLLQFIPMVGPQLFLIPGAILALAYKDYFHAVVLLILAAFLFLIPDNVIKPLVMKRTTDIHPVLVLMSFIGGVIAFGAKGFVIGPVILVVSAGLVRAWLKSG